VVYIELVPPSLVLPPNRLYTLFDHAIAYQTAVASNSIPLPLSSTSASAAQALLLDGLWPVRASDSSSPSASAASATPAVTERYEMRSFTHCLCGG
jgi:hypothetical protein